MCVAWMSQTCADWLWCMSWCVLMHPWCCLCYLFFIMMVEIMYVLIYMLITDLVSFRSGSIILDTGLSFGDEDNSLMLHNC